MGAWQAMQVSTVRYPCTFSLWRTTSLPKYYTYQVLVPVLNTPFCLQPFDSVLCLPQPPLLLTVEAMPSPEGDTAAETNLLLVSNRLPITIKRSDDGAYDFSMSSGGLVSGLSGLSKSTKFQWFGWPGIEVPESEIEYLNDKLKQEYNAVPVFLSDDLADKHYNGFSSAPTTLPSTTFPLADPLPVSRFNTVASVPLPSWRDPI